MPPKKVKPSKERLRELIREHNIRLEGPVPPKNWPPPYRHHFQAVRDIAAIRYDDYKANDSIEKEQRAEYRKRANILREKAYSLLQDVKINESTWRLAIEHHVMGRFDDHVICGVCENEVLIPYFEATPLNREMQIALNAKRSLRRVCNCRAQKTASRTTNHDGEQGLIFDMASGTEISHIPEDDFDGLSISMNPDRVIGLKSNIRPSSSSIKCSSPIIGREILYPFLVMEAKKELDAPGFLSIQKQTAFTIRRCLHVQQSLRPAFESVGEPFMVWFIAWQGEDWRVYAGVEHQAKVRIIELWYGTTQSQDGALQLLLIVDFIRSWARDIYRIFIRNHLIEHCVGPRSLSPALTDRFRGSISVTSAASPQDFIQDTEMQPMHQVLASPNTYEISDVSAPLPLIPGEQSVLHDEDSNGNSFLSWARNNSLTAPWIRNARIRHSNIVLFTFQVIDVTSGPHDALHTEDRQALSQLLSMALLVRREHVLQLASLWTNVQLPSADYSDTFYATFFFQTFCNQNDWQICRVLNCIIWQPQYFEPRSRANLDTLPAYMDHDGQTSLDMSKLRRAIQDGQRIRGKNSVNYALGNLSFVLLLEEQGRSVRWVSTDEIDMPAGATTIFIDLPPVRDLNGIIVECRQSFEKLSEIRVDSVATLPSTIPEMKFDSRRWDAMIAIRPRSWSTESPLFCLFVTLEKDYDNQRTLFKLLKQGMGSRGCVNAPKGYELSPEDRKILIDWKEILRPAN